MKSIKELLNFSFININKPTGPTSFNVSQYIKNVLKLSKAAHLGTLDPMVTGVLTIALGRACKLNDFFMHRNKTYVGIMRVHSDVEESKLKSIISEFIGKIIQLPPVRSRVKRAERERTIESFNILEIQGKDILFETEVQAGTYIRKLIHDIGEKMGGAHMLELRRTKAGTFSEDKIYTLYEFDEAVKEYREGNEEKLREMIVPAEPAIREILPVVQVNKNIKQILMGKPLMKSDVSEVPNETFAVFNKDSFIAIMKPVSEEDIIARSLFVFN